MTTQSDGSSLNDWITYMVTVLSTSHCTIQYLTLIDPCCINCPIHRWIHISRIKNYHWRLSTTQYCNQIAECLFVMVYLSIWTLYFYKDRFDMQYATSPPPFTQLNNNPPTMKAFKNKKVLSVQFITYNHFNATWWIKFVKQAVVKESSTYQNKSYIHKWTSFDQFFKFYLHMVRWIPRPAVCFRISRPTPVKPQNITLETWLCVTRSRPTSASPGSTLITPRGNLQLQIFNHIQKSGGSNITHAAVCMSTTVTAALLCFSHSFLISTTHWTFINWKSLKWTHILCQTTQYIPLLLVWIPNKLLSYGKDLMESNPISKSGDYPFSSNH